MTDRLRRGGLQGGYLPDFACELAFGAPGVVGPLHAHPDAGAVAEQAAEAPRAVLFSDTVGFIRKLPHHLVASFRSTLDEIAEADLVLHVIDRSHPRWDEQRQVGEEVMADLGIDPGSVPVTETLQHEVLSLPIGPHLSDEQVEHVVDRAGAFAA